MTVAAACPLIVSDYLGTGQSDEADKIREVEREALLDFAGSRALSSSLSPLSPEVRVELGLRWSDVCEAMFEFLAAHYPKELLKLVSSNVLAPPAMTFAAEIAGRTSNSQEIRATLVPLLQHNSALVREGAIYGLRDHADDTVVEKLRVLARSDPSAAIRQSARDTLEDL